MRISRASISGVQNKAKTLCTRAKPEVPCRTLYLCRDITRIGYLKAKRNSPWRTRHSGTGRGTDSDSPRSQSDPASFSDLEKNRHHELVYPSHDFIIHPRQRRHFKILTILLESNNIACLGLNHYVIDPLDGNTI